MAKEVNSFPFPSLPLPVFIATYICTYFYYSSAAMQDTRLISINNNMIGTESRSGRQSKYL